MKRRARSWAGRLAAPLTAFVLCALATAQSDANTALEELAAQNAAIGPALAYESRASVELREALRAATVDLAGAALQPSAALRWRPSLRWAGRDLDELPGALPSGSAPLTLSLSLRHDPGALARAERNAQRAEVAFLQRLNRDLRSALGAFIDLERAWIAERLAHEAALDAAATLARAEAAELPRMAADPTLPEPTTLSAARLAGERAEAALQRAGRARAEAEGRARGFGFDPARAAGAQLAGTLTPGALPLEGWRLALPAADAAQSPALRRAALELAIAEADAARAQAAALLGDLRLEANRTDLDLRLRGTLRLDEGRPSATLELDRQSAARPSWSVGFSASFEVGSGTLEGLRRAEAAVASAGAELDELQLEAARSLERARRTALDAEQDVGFAERGLDLARANLSAALERLQAARAETGASSDLEANAANRALVAFLRESDATYRAWERYLLEAERYWNEAGVLGGVLAPLPGGR